MYKDMNERRIEIKKEQRNTRKYEGGTGGLSFLYTHVPKFQIYELFLFLFVSVYPNYCFLVSLFFTE